MWDSGKGGCRPSFRLPAGPPPMPCSGSRRGQQQQHRRLAQPRLGDSTGSMWCLTQYGVQSCLYSKALKLSENE